MRQTIEGKRKKEMSQMTVMERFNDASLLFPR
jgi:hypothetical protein